MTDKNNSFPFDEDNYTHNIKRNNERSLDRRGFMKTMVGSAGLFALSTLPWGAVAAKELLNLNDKAYPEKAIVKVSELGIGEAVPFTYPGEHDKALLIRLGEHEYKAYQNACTHLLCPVFWDNNEYKLVCPCHKGFFDIETGAPTAGPPQRPLPEIMVKVKQDTIFATRVKRYEK